MFGRSIYSKAILIDTSALLALKIPKDKYYSLATNCLSEIAKKHVPIYISIPTIYESQRRILFDLGPRAAECFLDQIYDGTINIERTIPEDEQQSRKLISRYKSLNLTLTDAVNMAVMTRLGIATAFSFDKHFCQAGFIQVPPLSLK
jgi:predicted nucleic acid-binding protein